MRFTGHALLSFVFALRLMLFGGNMSKQLRLAAAIKGHQRYTGKPCVRGHGMERYTSSGQCVTCCAVSSKSRDTIIRDTLRNKLKHIVKP